MAVWVADHAGWLVKIDPARLKVIARRRLDFGPHGVVVAHGAVYVADAHGGRLLGADPETGKVERTAALSPGPIAPVVGAGWIWSSSAEARAARPTTTACCALTRGRSGSRRSCIWGQCSLGRLRVRKCLGAVGTESVVVRIASVARIRPTG